jgi:hypothetical protein
MSKEPPNTCLARRIGPAIARLRNTQPKSGRSNHVPCPRDPVRNDSSQLAEPVVAKKSS